ncbi:MAG: hypothetical protein ABSH10_04750 [Phycisphaerae bacterium]
MLIGLAVLLTSCTMVETTAEHERRQNRQQNLQLRMLVDDVDAVLLLDRSDSMTRWYNHFDY